MIEKNYNYPHLDMLQGGRIVNLTVEKNIDLFTQRRGYITLEYVNAFGIRINNAADVVATDRKKDQKEDTLSVVTIQKEATDLFTDFFADMRIAYRSNKDRLQFIYQALDYNKYYNKTKNHNQEALAALLLTFGKNVGDYQTELVEKGILLTNIERLKNLAQPFIAADSEQEKEKHASAKVTEDMQKELNAIYDGIMTLCDLGKLIFRKDQAMADQFTFSKIIAGFSSGNSNAPNNGDEPKPEEPENK